MSEQTWEPVWQQKRIDAIGLTLDFMAGVPSTEGIFEGIHYVVQSLDSLILGVWYGKNQNLETFRAGLGGVVTFGTEEEVTICGLAARRLVATVEASSAVGLVEGPDGSIGHIYSSSESVTHVAVSLTLRDQGVLIKWQVATAKREAYGEAEQHFWSAVTCTND